VSVLVHDYLPKISRRHLDLTAQLRSLDMDVALFAIDTLS